MRNIKLSNISKSFGDEPILTNLNLEIPSGSFFALLGPSGSGKTTLLRLIAGFETADSGTIHLGDTDITHVPIHKRRVNTVFQNYALFPHMNVFDNVAYSLKIAGKSKDFIDQKVRQMLAKVHLEKHIFKNISQLSGGQKQRVALARSIVNEPDVLLLDEPLAALDLKLREAMLLELIELQDTLKTTFVYVTHDQFEALTVADYMAIMNTEGEIEQVGSPEDVYEFPKSSFVAQFVGTTNLFEGTAKKIEEGTEFVVPELGVFLVDTQKSSPVRTTKQSAHTTETIMPYSQGQIVIPEGKVQMSIRPEKIEISKTRQEGFSNELTGTVDAIVYHGRSTQYNVLVKNGQLVQVFEQNENHFSTEAIDYDDYVFLQWQKENAVLLEK